MKKMTVFTATALMAATFAAGVAAPAQAQVRFGWGTPGFFNPERSTQIRQQIWELERDVERADRRGTVSDREAFSLRREVRSLRNWYEMSARNGLSYQEVRYLQDRVNRIRDRLRLERYGWGREDYWRNNDNNGSWRDRDRDGVPNRLGRDWDNDGIPDRMDRDSDNDGVPNSDDPDPYRRY